MGRMLDGWPVRTVHPILDTNVDCYTTIRYGDDPPIYVE